MKLQGRTVLITGGTSGIGMELARQLLERKNVVAVTGRDPEKLDNAARLLPGLHTFQSDVSDPDAVTALYESVLTQLPALDTLFNNAGVMRKVDFNQPRDLRDATREVEINLCGPIWMTQQFLPHLKTRPGAMLVNISSGSALVPFVVAPVYCAAKAGVHSFTQTLRVQMEGTGVTVVEVIPPGVETPQFRGDLAEEMKGQKGMDVTVFARTVLAGIEAGKLEIRPGLANVLSVMSRIAPAFMLRQMHQMMSGKKEVR